MLQLILNCEYTSQLHVTLNHVVALLHLSVSSVYRLLCRVVHCMPISVIMMAEFLYCHAKRPVTVPSIRADVDLCELLVLCGYSASWHKYFIGTFCQQQNARIVRNNDRHAFAFRRKWQYMQ